MGDAPEVGGRLALRAYVALGELSPQDVEVQLVHGRVDAEDQLSDPVAVPLSRTESYDGGRHRFDGEVELNRSGPFGYTVRVVPRHALLLTPAEIGVVALA